MSISGKHAGMIVSDDLNPVRLVGAGAALMEAARVLQTEGVPMISLDDLPGPLPVPVKNPTKWDTISIDRAEAKRNRRKTRRLTKGY